MSDATGAAIENPDCLIVGGGVIGLSMADRLAAEGLTVRVLEASGVGAGASGAAAGMLAPIGEADPESPVFALGLTSLRAYPTICERLRDTTGIDPEFEASGLLQLAFDEVTHDALRRRKEEAHDALRGAVGASAGAMFEWLDARELQALDAGISREAVGGFFSRDEAHLRPPNLVRALEASVCARGVRLDEGVRVQNLLHESGRVLGVASSAGRIHAGMTLLAAGTWTASILAASELDVGQIAVEPVRGQILSLEAPLPAMRMIAWAGDAYFVPKRDGSWVVGATQERVGFDARVTAEGVAWLLDQAKSVFPATTRARFGAAWAGLRPVTPDRLPVIGRLRSTSDLLIAAGHGRNGVLLAPETARIIGDLVLGKDPGATAAALAPDRLA